MERPPLLRALGRWSSALDADSLPDEVVHAARRAIVDTAGVAAAGGRHPSTRKVRDAFAGTPGPCSVAGGGRSAPGAAALINGTAAHAYDFDDTSYAGIMHGSALVLPAVLAAVEETGASDAVALAAFVAGSEVAYTVADVATHAHYFRGWWSTLTLGLLGAAAGVCRVYALDEPRTASALALAATGAGGVRALFGTDAKPFLAGEAARRALDFARAARSGVTGPETVLEARGGYLDLLNAGERNPEAVETVGRRWRLLSPGLMFKSHPVCSAAHAIIEQTADLVARAGAGAGDIDVIECRVPPLVGASLVHSEPATPQQAQFSLPFAAACAALHGGVRLRDLEPAVLADAGLRGLMGRVSWTVEREADREDRAGGHPEWAHVVLRLRDGRILEGRCAEPRGAPGRPLSDADLQSKFLDCTAFAGVDAGRARASCGALLGLPASTARTLGPLLASIWSAPAASAD